jgi:hypothetical protein
LRATGAQKRKDMIMNRQTMKRAAVVAIAGAVALGAGSPSWAAPVMSSTASVKQAAPSAVSDVRYIRGNRGRHYRNNGAGVALGVLGAVGAVAGAAAYGNHYGNRGYYREGYYGDGPSYGYRGPTTDGYGGYGGYDRRY